MSEDDKVFRAIIRTFDANNSMKADRKLPFVTVETLLDHIGLVIQQHRDWSTKMLISIDFPTTPQQVEKLGEDL